MSTASEAVGEDHTALQRSDAWCTALGRSSAHQAGSRFPSPAPHLLHSHCAQVVRRRHLKRACAGNHCGTGSQGGRAGGGGAGVRKLSGRGIGRLAGAVPSRPPPPNTHAHGDRRPRCSLPCPPVHHTTTSVSPAHPLLRPALPTCPVVYRVLDSPQPVPHSILDLRAANRAGGGRHQAPGGAAAAAAAPGAIAAAAAPGAIAAGTGTHGELRRTHGANMHVPRPAC